MSIHVALEHITHYRYDRQIQLGPQIVRLRPAPHCRTPILSYSLKIEPETHFVNWQQDPFANYQARLVFPEMTTVFKVTVDLVAEMAVYNPFDFFLEPDAEQFPFAYQPDLAVELAPYLVTDPPTPTLVAFVASLDMTPRRTIDFLVDVNQRLQQDIRYLIRMEPGVQSPEQTLLLKAGSCRDTGWLMVQALRRLGMAARFVSGYLIQLTPDVKALDGPSGAEFDFTDLHAWCEVYLPGAGWVGFDPTSGLLAGEGHIPLACTPSPGSAAPVSGEIDECEVEFDHQMLVRRVFESPRVTKPYTEGQWGEVLALGEQVDAELVAGDVRLTMGGEPTFVSVDDRDGGEWNTEALGPTKRIFAQDLVQRLRAEYGMGGFLHFGQGKWYPGEQLPRWALSVYWRADGVRCWRDPGLFADERDPHAYTADDARRFLTAVTQRLGLDEKFIQTGYEDTWYYLWRERQLPVNVDPFDSRLDDEMERARLRRVFDQGLGSAVGYALPIKRPLGPLLAGPRWVTGPWFFRDERMYLLPGDSPMGYRLPLGTLPWVTKSDFPYMHEQDPFAPRAPLPGEVPVRAQYPGQPPRADAGLGGSGGMDYGASTAPAGSAGRGAQMAGTVDRAALRAGAAAAALRDARSDAAGVATSDVRPANGAAGVGAGAGTGAGTGPGADSAAPSLAEAMVAYESVPTSAPQRFESATSITRTALIVEVRDPRRANGPEAESEGAATSVMYVFMPPLETLNDYLELLEAIEATAADQRVKIVLEGYPPPRDPRLKMLQVTPDPGVIEVNIHPAHDWSELVAHTEFLYEAAWLSRLSSEKFMLDGRHTGTGGGNHFVMGGATPADSPFLRRPELLASLLAYWHNHPSLSYMFSGMFIGPTSQAPRVDEARNDQLYELEIALGEIMRSRQAHGEHLPPWLVDRSLRNVLVDVSGNTHRSEFCIDKLYSPDAATGRLGLLELRAFEMPPHARMSIVQQLLLRALIARFWRSTYDAKLVRWGTELHDRFLLPTFVQMDFADVIEDMNAAGYAFDAHWFAPHFEFRFPKVGEITSRGVQMELRNALEPWHVMGEESTSTGTARYVDSSLERIEIKVSGLIDPRHRIMVNSVPVPLQPTGRVGEYVGGVRYRAWHPASALHPTIGVNVPLTFDLVDTWMQRSLGGCQYHVAHPGGVSYATLPVNAFEAESRRLGRFTTLGHTPGRTEVTEPQRSWEFPYTLDLRRAAR